jgi:hypothetical protein
MYWFELVTFDRVAQRIWHITLLVRLGSAKTAKRTANDTVRVGSLFNVCGVIRLAPAETDFAVLCRYDAASLKWIIYSYFMAA